MNIFLHNSSGVPLYQQLKDQLIIQIISGELQPGDVLPSMRVLAADLGISIITTKRAYEDLIKDGFLYASTTRGCFVADIDLQKAKSSAAKLIAAKLQVTVHEAKKYGFTLQELYEFLENAYTKQIDRRNEGENNG